MTPMRSAILAVMGVVVGTLIKMVHDEISSRLDRLPAAILRLAVRRLPVAVRDEAIEEWFAELKYIVCQTEGLPITRLARGVAFAVGLLMHGASIGRELHEA